MPVRKGHQRAVKRNGITQKHVLVKATTVKKPTKKKK